MEIAVNQEIDNNQGRVIGINTNAIHGDVVVNKLFQVQIYAFTEAGRTKSWKNFLEEGTAPYKFLSPYNVLEKDLFYGRDKEIENVLRHIREQPLLVVYGRAGIGKTSLLAAGVIPNLLQHGALVVHVQDYLQPVEIIRDALTVEQQQLPIVLPDSPTLPALVQTVLEATKGSLILVFDQFERIFEASTSIDERMSLVDGLADCLKLKNNHLLRVILVAQEEALGQVAALQNHIPDLLRSAVQIEALDSMQAQLAIESPLKFLGYPVSFEDDLLYKRLVPDLDELSPDIPGTEPAYLQIVCYSLYQYARGERRLITTKLYEANKNADGILARYMKETLETQFAAEYALVTKILISMASPTMGRWITPEQLTLGEVAPEQIHSVMERLVRAQFLVRRASDRRYEYAFANHVVAQEVRRLDAMTGERRYQLESEVEHAWTAWLVRDALVTRGQLRFLAEAGFRVTTHPVKAMLLLHSAVAHDEPVALWVACLNTDEGLSLLKDLEDPKRDLNQLSSRASKAALLLGLADRELPERPGPNPRIGLITWSAAYHPDQITRQTSVLALTVLADDGMINQLDRALEARMPAWQRRRRRVEWWVTLADLDPDLKIHSRMLSPLAWWEHGWLLLWRMWRLAFRDRYRVVRLMAGGAIGAGLGLATLRALLAPILQLSPVGAIFFVYFFAASLLGAALASGMALATSLRDIMRKPTAPTIGIWRMRVSSDRYAAIVGVTFGTLFFGFAHLIVSVLISLSFRPEPAVTVLGFAAGLALSIALYNQPKAGWRLGFRCWFLRVGIAIVMFTLIQWTFFLLGTADQSLIIGVGAAPYEQILGFAYFALVDAALMALVLTFGVAAGILFANYRYTRWQVSIKRIDA